MTEMLLRTINNFLVSPTALRAVVFALLISWSGTQGLKFLPTIKALPQDVLKGVVRLLAFLLAYVPVVVLWPSEDPWRVRLLAALTTALISPFAYSIGTTVLGHFFPWLQPALSKISATPDQGPPVSN